MEKSSSFSPRYQKERLAAIKEAVLSFTAIVQPLLSHLSFREPSPDQMVRMRQLGPGIL